MICPYCSTDMTPIELNGKVFCSNCGLTVANSEEDKVKKVQISPDEPKVLNNLTTDSPEEVSFPVIPEIVESVKEETEQPIIPNPEELSNTNEDITTPIDYFGQFGEANDTTNTPEGVKLTVTKEEVTNIPEINTPITDEISNDLGIVDTSPIEPPLESKISDLTIPTEDDFDNEPEVPAVEITEGTGSFVELENKGNTKETLEASSILLDILGEENNPKVKKLNPVLEPEIPVKTETKEEDDIYTLPTEVKVGLRNKKTNKAKTKIDTDEKIEKKIEKLEEKIAEAPEPIVDITPEEAMKYDPDTIENHEIDPENEKTKVIKEYFNSALEKDKKTRTKKEKKKKRKSFFKLLYILLSILLLVIAILVGNYFFFNNNKVKDEKITTEENASFSAVSPSYIIEGYTLVNSNFSNTDNTFETIYEFTTDYSKTITFKQMKLKENENYIADYLKNIDKSYTEKTVNSTIFTEVDNNNLIWEKDNFIFIIETNNYTYSIELLYKIAESVNL